MFLWQKAKVDQKIELIHCCSKLLEKAPYVTPLLSLSLSLSHSLLIKLIYCILLRISHTTHTCVYKQIYMYRAKEAKKRKNRNRNSSTKSNLYICCYVNFNLKRKRIEIHIQRMRKVGIEQKKNSIEMGNYIFLVTETIANQRNTKKKYT